MGNSQGGNVRLVQIEGDLGEIDEATTQQTLHESIWDNIHCKRFYLAEQVPICQGGLRGDFGYTAFSPTSRKVLEGRYNYPEVFDPATLGRMCTDTPGSAKAVSGNNYSNTGMGETMKASKGIHLVINFCPTLWTLKILGSITNHLPISCSKNESFIM